MKLDIDIGLFLFVALGANEYLQKDIEQLYQEKEMEYYQAYKESVYFNVPVFKRYLTKKSESMKRLAGIREYERKRDNDETVLKLIKKGYKFAYQYFNQRTKIDVGDFLARLSERKGGIDVISEAELFHNGIVMMFLCTKFKKPYTMNNHLGEFMAQGFKNIYFNTAVSEMGYTDRHFKEYQEGIQELHEHFLVKGKKDITLDAFFDSIIMKEEYRQIDLHPFATKEEMRTEVFKTGINRYIGAFSGWIKVLGLDEVDITRQVLTPKEIDTVFLQALQTKEGNGFTSQEERDMYIIGCLVMMVLVKEYRNTQQEYFEDMKTHLYDEVLQLRENLQNEQESIQEKEKNLKIQESQLLQENERLHTALEESERKQKSLQKQVEETEQNNKELFALREFLFSLEQEESDVAETMVSVEEMVVALKGKTGCIVGGKPNWQNKLKEYLPAFTFVSPENKGIDFSFVDKLDVVFVNSTYNNHALYRKLMSRMNKNETPLHYLPNSTNTDILLNSIYKKMI